MNRQRVILFVLVILFAAAALWSYNAMPRHKTIAPTGNTPGQQAKQEAKPVLAASEKTTRVVDDGTILKINLLDKEASGFKGYRRNIFKPVLADEIKAVKRQAAAIIPPPKNLPATVTATAPIAVQPETAPLARFTFLGFLKRGSVKTIFLAKEKDILLVKKGDVVAGRYEATDISDQALTLTVTDTGDEIVIPLIENKPLATVK
jgi:hypothetical protein